MLNGEVAADRLLLALGNGSPVASRAEQRTGVTRGNAPTHRVRPRVIHQHVVDRADLDENRLGARLLNCVLADCLDDQVDVGVAPSGSPNVAFDITLDLTLQLAVQLGLGPLRHGGKCCFDRCIDLAPHLRLGASEELGDTLCLGKSVARALDLTVLISDVDAVLIDEVAVAPGRDLGLGCALSFRPGGAPELEALDDLELAVELLLAGDGLLGRWDLDLVVALRIVEPAVGTFVELVACRVVLLVPDLLAVDVDVGRPERHAVGRRVDVPGLLGADDLRARHAVGTHVPEYARQRLCLVLDPVDVLHAIPLRVSHLGGAVLVADSLASINVDIGRAGNLVGVTAGGVGGRSDAGVEAGDDGHEGQCGDEPLDECKHGVLPDGSVVASGHSTATIAVGVATATTSRLLRRHDLFGC